MLDPGAPGFTYQTFDDVKVDGKARKDPSLTRVFHGSLDDRWNELVDLNRRGAGVFITVNETDGRGREAKNVVRVRAVWQDDDAGHGWTVPLKPSIVVSTSPGKAHRYLLVDGLSFDDHAAAMAVMVDQHGSDKNAKDISRVLRLPGFVHMKEQHKPYLVRIVDGEGRRYSREDILKALPPPAQRRRTASKAALLGKLALMGDDDVARYKSAVAFLHEETDGADLHDRDTWLDHGMALHHATNGNEQGFLLWCEASEQYAPRKYDAKDQQKTWDSFKASAVKPLTLATIFKRATDAGWQPPVPEPEQFDAELERLAGLATGKYYAERAAASRRLSVPQRDLDRLVSEKRKELEAKAKGSLVPDDEPWPEVVNGVELLDEIVAVIRRYAILPDHAAEAVALWCLHSFAHDAAVISPILAVQSPEKRCGKTTLLIIISCLVSRGLVASNASTAVIFRLVDTTDLTLLFDEADTFIRDENSELRGLLNSGHNRRGATFLRCVGDNHEPKAFKTWCPKVIAGIGTLPETLQDRSVVIAMRRRSPDDPAIESLRLDRTHDFARLRRKAARWADDHLEGIRERDPEVPSGMNDRAADNWRPLLAIADEAGGPAWPQRARDAAKVLSAQNDEATASWTTELLRDIREVFDGLIAPATLNPQFRSDRLSASKLAESLAGMKSGRWAKWGKDGKPITTHTIARALKGFGIKSWEKEAGNFYFRADFEDAWRRYVPKSSIGQETEAESAGERNPPKKAPDLQESARNGGGPGTSDDFSNLQPTSSLELQPPGPLADRPPQRRKNPLFAGRQRRRPRPVEADPPPTLSLLTTLAQKRARLDDLADRLARVAPSRVPRTNGELA
jgi:putative DNA primase/helicase